MLERWQGSVRDGVPIRLSPKRFSVLRVLPAADGAVRVENTGPPLSADEVAELTEPFRRGGRDRTAAGAGAGFGLTIVDTIMAVHGGSLRLRARDGGGIVVMAASRWSRVHSVLVHQPRPVCTAPSA
ncbi:ATP-binding protein [Actinosynnema sp. NPDC091369]